MLLLAAAAAVAVLAYGLASRRAHPGGGVISVSGNIEVTEVELSFRIPGWVKDRPVDEGQTVAAGEVVARLDDTELAQEAAARQADVQAAQAALDELLAGSRPEEIAQVRATTQRSGAFLEQLLTGSRPEEIAASAAAVEAARVEVQRTKLDYDRLHALYEKGVARDLEHDTARAAYEAAQARLEEARQRLKIVRDGPRKEEIQQARSALEEAQQRLALVEKGPRQETIDQARARLEQVKQALALARTRLGYATITAPVSGLVLSKNVEPGEYVSPGTGVVTVADLRSVYLRAYVDEGDLGRVKVGQSVRVTTDTFPDKAYSGRVSFIASEAEFTPKNVQTAKERQKLVYRIKVDIANPGMELKPGMPADAEIQTGPDR
jgi:HlyD family secretion protein